MLAYIKRGVIWSSSFPYICQNSKESVSIFLDLFEPFPNRYLLAQSQISKHHDNLWNLFQVKDKNTIATSLTSFCCISFLTLTNFTRCSDVSVVDFERENELGGNLN